MVVNAITVVVWLKKYVTVITGVNSLCAWAGIYNKLERVVIDVQPLQNYTDTNWLIWKYHPMYDKARTVIRTV